VMKRNIVRQAAEDWAYFFGQMNLNTVAAGAESTFIWNSNGFISGHYITNANPYVGFLLYVYGINQMNPPFRSGGEGSAAGGFGHETEIKGNYNTLGWYLATGDADWWKASNAGNEQNDLSSAVHLGGTLKVSFIFRLPEFDYGCQLIHHCDRWHHVDRVFSNAPIG